MGKVLVTEDYLSDIGDAIRAKNGQETTYKPSQMAEAINAIVTAVLEEKAVTENGVYLPSEGVDGFSKVTVSVNPTLEEKSVTDNGVYLPSSGVYGFSKVTVSVPNPIKCSEERLDVDLTEVSTHIESDTSESVTTPSAVSLAPINAFPNNTVTLSKQSGGGSLQNISVSDGVADFGIKFTTASGKQEVWILLENLTVGETFLLQFIIVPTSGSILADRWVANCYVQSDLTEFPQYENFYENERAVGAKPQLISYLDRRLNAEYGVAREFVATATSMYVFMDLDLYTNAGQFLIKNMSVFEVS